MSKSRIKTIVVAGFTAAGLIGGMAATVAPAVTTSVVAQAPSTWYHT